MERLPASPSSRISIVLEEGVILFYKCLCVPFCFFIAPHISNFLDLVELSDTSSKSPLHPFIRDLSSGLTIEDRSPSKEVCTGEDKRTIFACSAPLEVYIESIVRRARSPSERGTGFCVLVRMGLTF